ncbi:hypothetical protein ACWEQO_02455 [Streptomyces sp. NPDC004051]
MIIYEGGGVNGNPLYHWMALAVFTALALPWSVAVLAEWTPPRMRERQAGMRLRAYGMLCMYGLALANAIPRIADASIETVLAFTNVGLGFGAAAVVLFLLSVRKGAVARRTGPAEPGEG